MGQDWFDHAYRHYSMIVSFTKFLVRTLLSAVLIFAFILGWLFIPAIPFLFHDSMFVGFAITAVCIIVGIMLV